MLKALQLSKSYGSHHALKNLSLEIGPGEIFCLLGQNGAGKTTTINLFSGFIAASSGQALINNIEVKPGTQEYKKHIAYIPEVVHLYGHLSAVENLDLFSRLAGLKYSHTELAGFLQQTGLPESAYHRRLSTFSKGMRQKTGIAIAIAKNAGVILMDEPTSGLDPKATNEFTTLCKGLAASGKTLLIATHDIFNAVGLANRIGIMKEGELVHIVETSRITANELQDLYLETI